MLKNEEYDIVKMHICPLERKGNLISLNLNDYPERVCVLDKINKTVIDVENGHQYPYIRVMNMQYFLDIQDVKKITDNNRIGCIEYATFFYTDIEKDVLDRCMEIIEMLKKGITFPNGNDVLTNEEYLKSIEKQENSKKVKKKALKRK